MPKIQLTIKVSYLETWGAYEGVRELIQNGRDAEVEHGATMKVDWHNDTLRIENDGVTMPLKALLLGHTTKLGNSKLIGKFGEGLKLGVLALVRAGHTVKIRNGSEVWAPTIERSELFDEDVLTFNIDKGRANKNRVRVEIGGVNRMAWEKFRQCFLFLAKPKKGDVVDTWRGDLLLGDEYKGRIYVKGLFVQTDPELRFGYDLPDAELDLDRKMVESYDLKYRTKDILLAAVAQNPALLMGFTEMLETPTTETEGISEYTSIPSGVSDKVAEDFKSKHGEDAVPVASLAESKDIEHLGKKGIVVSSQLGQVLAKSLGNALTVKEGLKREVIKRYSWHDLADNEKAALTEAVDLVDRALHTEGEELGAIKLDDIEVVDFRDVHLMGQFKDGRTILLAHKYLCDPDETLRIIIHEVAHRFGSDGDKGHVFQMEVIWKNVVAQLRSKA